MIFVDTNIFIDLLGPPGPWESWSAAALGRARTVDRVVASPIVLAELVRYADSADDLAELPRSFGVELQEWQVKASFLAGRAFQRHVAQTGRTGSVLADFLIGGHAAALGAAVLTRDPRLLRAGFPDLPLVTPETHP